MDFDTHELCRRPCAYALIARRPPDRATTLELALSMIGTTTPSQTFVFGAVRLARPRGYEPFTWNPYGTRLLITSTAVCFGVGLPAAWIGIPWWIVPAVAVPVVVCAAGLMHHRLRPRAAGGV
ncbi:hypothetical protein ACFXKC_53280 [Streptomyces sp. NPDC059340]|uniref:hypothetical protein n=1 Tax=Streptomyces sp. NPDC059340 TaxID=3346806 RepID=UPI00368C6EE6